MKIILSRKGFDSTEKPFLGGASPIFGGKQLLSLPIPEVKRNTIRYSEVRDPTGHYLSLAPIVEQLTKRKITGESFLHLDPDLRPSSRFRLPDWRPIFGQEGRSQGHLRNQGVGRGDLFLFYGRYQNVVVDGSRVTYDTADQPRHVIWGWLAVGDLLKLASATDEPDWARYHPHFSDQRAADNTVYIAAEHVFGKYPGAGVFDDYEDDLCLTDLECMEIKTSEWRLPRWCAPQNGRDPFTGQSKKAWTAKDDCVLLRTKSPGQEYVLDTRDYPQAENWAESLIARTQGKAD